MTRWRQAAKEILRPYYLKWLYFRLFPEKCPASFDRWKAFPEYREGQPIPPQQELPDVVFLSMADWHGPRQRSQQLALALAELGHRCFYVNPHLGREMPRPFPLSPRRSMRVLAPNVFELHIHLASEPVFHHRMLRCGEAAVVADTIVWALDCAESRSQVLISSLPLWTDAAERLRQSRGASVLYDCHDLLEGLPDVGEDLILAEPAAMEMADAVVFSAEWLAREHSRRNPAIAFKSELIRNGANPNDFSAAAIPGRSRAHKITIGYIGTLSFWFESEVVAAAAERHPDWRFVLVGPQAGADLARLRKCPNVELSGEIDYGDLPAWMSRFDVAMIPFRLEPLTLATNPIKLYEYFAAGLPVVSSPLPELQPYAGLVYVASHPEEFVDQLEAAVAEDSVELRQERREVAEGESWRARARSLQNCMSSTEEDALRVAIQAAGAD
ncbi:MAG: glycosyltransferase [Acidobacteria bacterium]|nr:glycosyltransferase [Acidobacteriota bacterium]